MLPIARAAERMEDALLSAFRIQREHHAATVTAARVAAVGRRAVEITRRAEDQRARRIAAVDATGETVQHAFAITAVAVTYQLENGTGINAAAEVRRAVQIAG